MNSDEKKTYNEGNQNALKTGVFGAIKRVSEGKPLIGLAAEEEKAVLADVALSGINRQKKSVAVKLQAVLNLCWYAIEKASQEDNLTDLERFVKLFSLLSTRTIGAWNDVIADEKEAAKGGASVIDVLNSIKRAQDGK